MMDLQSKKYQGLITLSDSKINLWEANKKIGREKELSSVSSRKCWEGKKEWVKYPKKGYRETGTYFRMDAQMERGVGQPSAFRGARKEKKKR